MIFISRAVVFFRYYKFFILDTTLRKKTLSDADGTLFLAIGKSCSLKETKKRK